MSAGYAVLGALVLFGFDGAVRASAALFVTVNFWISAAFVGFFRQRPSRPLHVLLYGIFVAAYVAKAVVQYLTGLNTAATLDAIRTQVTPGDYLEALAMVTAAHVVVVLVLAATSGVEEGGRSIGTNRYLSGPAVHGLMLGILAWVVVSSLVMAAFGVAVMGTEGVRLPFKMSALLYYSRLIALPMALLYIMEKAVVEDDHALLRRSLGLFVILAASEVAVRATKAPPFLMVVQVGVLMGLLSGGGLRPSGRARRDLLRVLGVTAIAGLLLWPFMEVYRTGLAGLLPSDLLRAQLGAFASSHGGGILITSLDAMFSRLQGFLQFLGLVATPGFHHDLATVVRYGDLSTYYTGHYLGYHTSGHASSPSLLGAALILGGTYGWYLVLAGYLLALWVLWRLAGYFRHMALPVRCFVATESANVVVGGTLEGSLVTLALVFGVALLCELLLVTGMHEGGPE